ncbi:pilus assembly protein [Dechloromonas agitata]|uniref:pilus assembly PilX family protein n=1 Tax=Dechloromonas agitata TaxID=73030 RepID=UPI00237D7164|nr:pilus assembly protein [Dechloromonas agitata]MDE1545415.1 pilus assembly protein [Dechloromonas agitata]
MLKHICSPSKIKIKKYFGKQEQGISLVISLLFLVVLSMLALTAIRTNIVEEKLAGNSRDWTLAFEAAEAALREGEKDIQSGTRFIGETGFDINCINGTNGLCKPQTDGTAIWQDLEQAGNTGWLYGANIGPSIAYGTYASPNTSISSVAKQPRYIIEVITEKGSSLVQKSYGSQGNQYVYRITARGFGASVDTNGNPIARVTLQSTYKP